ncbi:MAG: Stage III sporulation protein AE [Syntrophomonadaceae bacterium]|nr:Stage III sporulation protein AE [Bacillota bacterium]
MGRNGQLLAICLTFLMLLLPAPLVAALGPLEIAEQQAQEIGLAELEKFWPELQEQVGEYMPDFQWQDLLRLFQPGNAEPLSLAEVLNGLWRYLWREIYLNLRLLGKLLFLAVVAALLKNLEKAFARESIATLTQTIVHLALVLIAMQSFAVAVNLGRQTVDNLVELIMSAIPLLLTLLAALGSLASAAIFRPLIIFAVNFFASLTSDFIFPLIYLTTILSVINQISPRVTVGRLAELLKQVSVWSMGLSMTIFTGLLAVHGVAAAVGDAVTIRTAKFMTGAFLPVVGGMLTEAVETVAGATLILKNSVHLAGVLLVFYLVAFPALKILALVFIYKLAAALIQPLGETALSEALNTFSNCLALIFAAVAIVGLFFYLAITIIAAAGNTSFMLR